MPIDGALLEIEDLNAWYGESHVLHGISFDLREGETLSLIGRNGAGKTTTLRAILGIVRNRKGTIRFRGEDLTAVPLHAMARRGIGYVPEERGIFASLTVAENLVLPPVVRGGGMSEEEIYGLFPNLAERRSSQGTKLSGGEQQMLAIARILRTGADVMLLDEPTEGLAPVIVERIGEVHAAAQGPRHDDRARRAEFPFRAQARGSLCRRRAWARDRLFRGFRARCEDGGPRRAARRLEDGP